MGISLQNIKLRVTDYSRVSTDHLEQKKSLQNQVEHFEKYIKDNKNWTYIKGYVDDGISGTSDIKRDNFMQMIEDAKQDKFDLIITKEISRFSRNTLDSIKYTRELLSYGVAVLFINDNINTALPDSELRLTIMASMAQDEIRRLSERVKFGMNRAIERGEILGNDKMYGYKKDKTKGNLKIIEEEAKVIKEIYELYVEDKLSLSKICKQLNRENHLTRENNKWCVSTISRMIENPKYKGYYCGKKSEIIDYMNKKVKYFDYKDWIVYEDKIKIPPIIEEELWKKANQRLQKRKKAFKNKKTDKTLYKNRYLYSSKIYCKEHNTVFYRRKFTRTNNDYTWVCSRYLKEGKKVCDSANIRESELNSILKDVIASLEINFSKIISLLINLYNNVEDSNDSQKKEENIKRKINIIHLKKDKLLDLYLTSHLKKEEFDNKNNLLNKEIKTLENSLNNLMEQKERINKNKEILKKIKEKINTEEILNETIRIILDYITAVKLEENKINLDIFLSYNTKNKGIKNNYSFKREEATKGKRKYSMNYQVNYIFK